MARYSPLTHDGIDKVEGSLRSDGTRVYFQESASNGLKLANVSAAGGDTGQVQVPNGLDAIYDLSPRTSKVLASASLDGKACPLWVVSLISAHPRRVGELNVTDAKWSPDGLQIAFALREEL